MCGIAGVINLAGSRCTNFDVMESMLEVMRHRGPDDRGIKAFGSTVLGHLRLSILDLSSRGHQPMTVTDDDLWIVYNGEVYNYVELRKELEVLGAFFHSETDTEVILKAYQYWGLDCFRRFNGMWSLAIWDNTHKRMVLSRDRVGIKPLYWAMRRGELVFASEIKGILAHHIYGDWSIELNQASVNEYMARGLVDGLEDTFFKGIRRFRPGNVMVLENGDISCYKPFWDLAGEALHKREHLSDDEDELAEELYALMHDAVRVHSRSDVPVGCCLSGGMDSSTVSALANEFVPKMNSFTSYFSEGPEYNELKFANEVNRAFGFKSKLVEVDGSELLNKLADMLWILDEPTLALGVYPQWHVMELAAKDVKVVLDGQGGDELFGGYDPYAEKLLYSKLLNKDFKGYQKILSGYARVYGLQKAEELGLATKKLWLKNESSAVESVFPGHLDNFLYREVFKTKLPALLRYEDRLSMAFSIESRVPVLDYRVIEFAFALPEDLKVGPGWSKYIMRRAMEKVLPESVVWRKDKKGFPVPMKLWMQGPMRDIFQHHLFKPQGMLRDIIGLKQLKSFFDDWDRGVQHEWQLWRLLSLETWLQTYLSRLNQEVRKVVKSPSIDISPGKIARSVVKPEPLEIVISMDYETFDTNDSLLSRGNDIDWCKDLIDPANKFVKLLEEVGAKLTIMWDTVEYFWLKDNGFDDITLAIETQLKKFISDGHDVQLHLHPSWKYVERKNGRWIWTNPAETVSRLLPEDLDELVKRSVETMHSLFRPINPGYSVRGFRGRGYEVEPFRSVAPILKKYGIRADSSLHGVAQYPVNSFNLAKEVGLPEADFLEYPIYRPDRKRWDFSARAENALIGLDSLSPKVEKKQSVMMIGHSKQKIYFEETKRCLLGLKKKYGDCVRFRRWQDCIDEDYLDVRLNESERGVMFSKTRFENRWQQEDDPFSSMQVEDPYYQLLLKLISQRKGSLLDLGCAEGLFTHKMAQVLESTDVVGVDISESAINRCRTNFPNYEFYAEDMAAFALKKRFDLVMASQNIIYFNPDERFHIFRNIERMMSDDGLFILAWWADADRGFRESEIHSEASAFFDVEEQLSYSSTDGDIKGNHLILKLKRRLSLSEEDVFCRVRWDGLRVGFGSSLDKEFIGRVAPRLTKSSSEVIIHDVSNPKLELDVVLCADEHDPMIDHLRLLGTLIIPKKKSELSIIDWVQVVYEGTDWVIISRMD